MRAASRVVSLEKYTLRALIYRDHCAVQNADALIVSFERDFGAASAGIKEGRPLRDYPILKQVETGAGSPYRQLTEGLARLEAESERLFGHASGLATAELPLARYLYDSERTELRAELRQLEDPALELAAESLVTTAEHLKFLKYDVARKKYDPDQVFQHQNLAYQEKALSDFEVAWPKPGDYWRNERTSYRGAITQQCNE